MNLLTEKARAYIYSGEWVADCPREGCGNVEYLWSALQPNGPRVQPKAFFACSYCGWQGQIDWPDPEFMVRALDILMKRPVPGNRNWYPSNHDVALRFRLPHGQSLDDLRAENHEHGVSV
jgi:hypothetical protein